MEKNAVLRIYAGMQLSYDGALHENENVSRHILFILRYFSMDML